jgi:CheY-like chemotaxis protein
MSPGNGRDRFHDFQDLMRHRITDILLVASPYDAFVLEEAGELGERLLGEFRNLDLHYAPGLTAVTTGAEALALAREQRRFNLVVTTPQLADMNAAELAERVRAEGLDVPVVVLAWDSQEVRSLAARHDLGAIERAYVWLGDARILVAMLKAVEDRRNAPHDVSAVGVQVILLIEDSIRNYSAFLPVIYSELFHHSRKLIGEGANLSQKILRMRARPKILLATTFEEAEAAFDLYHEDVLGVISDVEFPRGGTKQPDAGAEFARRVRAAHPDIPIMLHSSHPENAALAASVGAAFLRKGSDLVLEQLRRVLLVDFGFGDFVFRRPDGEEVGRAVDLRQLEQQLASVPEETIVFHASRNHFSRWLKARTEFALAHELRPRQLADYPDAAALRADLIGTIAAYRDERAQVVVADFDRTTFDFSRDFYRIGGGSLGGKARGLAFVRRLLAERGLRRRFPGVEIRVPAAVVLATDVFDRFLDDNDLRRFAVECEDDEEIVRRFVAAPFPEEAERDLAAFVERVRVPLAVRSSSLLEDSHHLPFTGVYDTLMLANGSASVAERARAVAIAVRRIYASTFNRHAKAYLRATSYRLEEERMAVIVQRLVGAARGPRFYPDFAGVARSHNFYPSPPMLAEDGIAAAALGLGRTIVEGGTCVRFSPRYPQLGTQHSSFKALLDASQRGFWALPLDGPGDAGGMREAWYGLEVAEADGTLAAVGSTYSRENDALYDGLARPGLRVVTFAPVLKHRLFPLAEILDAVMEEGSRGMGTPVEIEFAVDLAVAPGRRSEFGLLQIRPLALARESEALEIGRVDEAAVLCASDRALGHGAIAGIRDLVVVDFQRFERARSREAAAEVGRLNAHLLDEGLSYLLVGVGRWGSRDPWLGIPVSWDQVSGAAVIVEAGLRDLRVTPSQGSHFFQNLTSFNVGFLTVNPEEGEGVLDWEWLDAQPALSAAAHVRHLRLPAPVEIRIDGRRGRGVILKPPRGSP